MTWKPGLTKIYVVMANRIESGEPVLAYTSRRAAESHAKELDLTVDTADYDVCEIDLVYD